MGVDRYTVTNGTNDVHTVKLTVEGSTVEVNLYGATVTSYTRQGRPFIFVSKQAVFDNKKAIRGGIPIVFPHFGPWSHGPQHGFARTSMWKALEAPETDLQVPEGAMALSLELTDSEATRAMWDHAFRLVLTLVLARDSLTQELRATNTGSNVFDFTALLHTYFLASNVHDVKVNGLGGCTFDDKVTGRQGTEGDQDITVDRHVDSVYHSTPSTHHIAGLDGAKGPTVRLTKRGLPDTVVWNPWAEGARAMADFGDDEYTNMICVEAGAVGCPIQLAGGQTWTASQTISVE